MPYTHFVTGTAEHWAERSLPPPQRKCTSSYVKTFYSILRHFRINHCASLGEAYNKNSKNLNYSSPEILKHFSLKSWARNLRELIMAKVSTRSSLRTLQLAGILHTSHPSRSVKAFTQNLFKLTSLTIPWTCTHSKRDRGCDVPPPAAAAAAAPWCCSLPHHAVPSGSWAAAAPP